MYNIWEVSCLECGKILQIQMENLEELKLGAKENALGMLKRSAIYGGTQCSCGKLVHIQTITTIADRSKINPRVIIEGLFEAMENPEHRDKVKELLTKVCSV